MSQTVWLFRKRKLKVTFYKLKLNFLRFVINCFIECQNCILALSDYFLKAMNFVDWFYKFQLSPKSFHLFWTKKLLLKNVDGRQILHMPNIISRETYIYFLKTTNLFSAITQRGIIPLRSVPSKKGFEDGIYFVGDVMTCACEDRDIQQNVAHQIFLCVSGVSCQMLYRPKSVIFPPQPNSWGYIRLLRVFRKSVRSFFIRNDFTVHLNSFRRITLQYNVPWLLWQLYHTKFGGAWNLRLFRTSLEEQTLEHTTRRLHATFSPPSACFTPALPMSWTTFPTPGLFSWQKRSLESC